MDVTKCRADGREDHSCTHDQDVHVRCKKPTWAGTCVCAKQAFSCTVEPPFTVTSVKRPAIKINYGHFETVLMYLSDSEALVGC